MQTVTTDQRNQIGSSSLAIHAWLEITDPDGSWVDVSTGLDTPDWFNSAQITENIDSNTVSFSASLLRDTGTLSLCPLRQDSTINRNGVGAYAPMLDVKRKWRVKTAVVAQGVTPVSGDIKEVGSGVIDVIDPQDSVSEIRITGRGMEADILDAQIKVVRTYCSDAPVLVETVIQQLLDDNMGTGADLQLGGLSVTGSSGITLYSPGYSPAFYVNMGYRPATGNLMDAITKLAQLAGLVCRYRYDSSNVNRFTLFQPPRDAVTADWSIGPDEYMSIPLNRLDLSGVRTLIDLYYIDPTLGEQHVTSPANLSGTVSCTTGTGTFSASQSGVIVDGDVILVGGALYRVSAFDGTTGCTLTAVADGSVPTFSASSFTASDSITRYGVRYMRVDVAGTVTLSSTQAQAMVDAMLSDIDSPRLEQQFTTYGFWFVQLYDFGETQANAVHYNINQQGGVTAITQNFSGGTLKTTVDLAGKIKGRYRTWLQYANTPVTSGLDIPAKPGLSERINVDGTVDVFVDGDEFANETRVLIRTDRAPTTSELLASTYTTGQGVQDGWILNVATVAAQQKFYLGGISLNDFGIAGERQTYPSANIGVGTTALPSVSADGSPVAQSGQVLFPVVTNATAVKLEVWRGYSASDPSTGSTYGIDVKGRSAGAWKAFYAGTDYTPGTTFWIPVVMHNGGYYALLSILPVDGFNIMGAALNLKALGAGGSPPTDPGKPTIGTPTATAHSFTATVTAPSSGATIATWRLYADGVAIGTVTNTAAPGGTQSITWSGFSPSTTHQLQISGVTSGGVEGPLSDLQSSTTTADTSGGGSGTGDNGKLPAPVAGLGTYSRPDQASLLAFTFGSGTPSGMRVRIWQASTIGGVYSQIGLDATSSPAIADASQSSSPQLLYYKLSCYDPAGGYTESDLSSAITVNVPAGSA